MTVVPTPSKSTQFVFLVCIAIHSLLVAAWNNNAFSRSPLTRKVGVSYSGLHRDVEIEEQFLSSSGQTALLAQARGNNNDADNGTRMKSPVSLEVVLFGIGDLRVRDHSGLVKAWEKVRSSFQVDEILSGDADVADTGGATKILPLFIYDPEAIRNVPGGICSYTLDTATMISTAVDSINSNLDETFGIPLQVLRGGTVECLRNIAAEADGLFEAMNVHVCDLGPADISMRYSPLSRIVESGWEVNDQINVVRWDCNLRKDPWSDVSGIPDQFPAYESQWDNVSVESPVSISDEDDGDRIGSSLAFVPNDAVSNVELEDILSMLVLDDEADAARKMEESKSTGLFGTHWGGFNNAVCTEKDSLECLRVFVDECGMDDDKFLASEWYRNRWVANPRSLEHATLRWNMAGKDGRTEAKSLLGGELFTRCISAPMLMGCISTRQIYHAGATSSASDTKGGILSNMLPLGKATNPLIDTAERHEWHRLFAAKSLVASTDANGQEDGKAGRLKYSYWRWQGFLCRYGVTELAQGDPTVGRQGVVLVHGFGASGSQWTRSTKELHKAFTLASEDGGHESSNTSPRTALVPDLIGFGQCEKPIITYTQYLWESQVAAFVKEIGIGKIQLDSYVVGGNSIGGYTSMGVAADDAVQHTSKTNDDKLTVTGSGAPGSGRCVGVVLMNSAGRMLTREESEQMLNEPAVAELTATNGLPPCSPPPKFVTTVGGNGLLWYLRPRIQSICKNLYPSNPDNVDDDLCGGILRDSLDPGALAVMMSGAKLPPPRTANELLGADFGAAKSDSSVIGGCWKGPVLVAQGMNDPLNDATGRANLFRSLRDGIDLEALEGGHCPHDELPGETAEAITRWIVGRKSIAVNTSATPKATATA